MQSYDELNRMVSALTVESKQKLDAIVAEIDKAEIGHIVIGKLPAKGQEITINGLVFLVKFVDYKRGTIQLRIKKYEEDTEDRMGLLMSDGKVK